MSVVILFVSIILVLQKIFLEFYIICFEDLYNYPLKTIKGIFKDQFS